tara:strand:+ start:4123 stop:5322 length:1200 start_codon:yes stop_codon:yes gene_type:complete
MSVSRKLQMGAAGASSGGGGGGGGGLIIPIASSNASNTFLHFLDTADGQVKGTFQFGQYDLKSCACYRYGDYLYVFHSYGSKNWTKIDLTDYSSAATGTITNNLGFGYFSPISDSQLLRVSSVHNKFYIFDMANGTETAYTYTAGTNTGYAQTHATLTFYDVGTSGIINEQDKIFWTTATNPNYNSDINHATLTGTSMSTFAAISGAGNYSRNYACQIDVDYGLIWLFDSQMKRITRSSSTVTSIYPASLSYGGNTLYYRPPNSYSAYGYSGNVASDTGVTYGVWDRWPTGTIELRVCAYNPISNTSPAPTHLFEVTGGGYYYYNVPEMAFAQINTSGHMFIAWFDHSSANNATIKSRVYDGSTLIGSEMSDTVSSSYTGTYHSHKMGPLCQSYFGPIQ